MTGMMDYLASMLKALAQKRLMTPRKTGSGQWVTRVYRSPSHQRHDKYPGAALRELRKTHR